MRPNTGYRWVPPWRYRGGWRDWFFRKWPLYTRIPEFGSGWRVLGFERDLIRWFETDNIRRPWRIK